jgi:hypothetical protein
MLAILIALIIITLLIIYYYIVSRPNISQITNNVDLGNIFIGNYGSADSSILTLYNISAVLNVSDRDTYDICNNITYKFIKLHDNILQCLFPHIINAYYFIDKCISQKKNILVHCMAGSSRSVIVVAYYLMKKYNMNLDKALRIIKSRHSIVSLNESFYCQLGCV